MSIFVVFFIILIFIGICYNDNVQVIDWREAENRMQNIDFGNKLQILRKKMKLSQKEFAEFLGIPQPSMSAYENGRNSPTMEVLINIAQKCNVSLDWLCGISSSQNDIATLGDVADFFYKLLEINEIGGEIEIHDRLFNDLETETEKWYTRITFYGNDHKFKYNSSICGLLTKINENYNDLESFSVSKEMYDMAKEKTKEHYSVLPLTKKTYPELSREERMKKHMDYLKTKQEIK